MRSFDMKLLRKPEHNVQVLRKKYTKEHCTSALACVNYKNKPTVAKAAVPLVKRKVAIMILGSSTVLIILLCIILLGAKKNVMVALSDVPKNLTLGTLLAAEREEPRGGAMRDCLEKAAQEFSEEPRIVKSNAKMTLHCNGTKREFLSGKGENLIEVVWINGKVSYELSHEAHPDVYLARLGRHPLPLSLSSIVGVLQDVSSHNGSEELQNCLRKALGELPLEPLKVQDNAKMVVTCDGKTLTFVSGKGQSEINVFREKPHGQIQYMVKATGEAWWARFFKRRKV